MEMVANTLHLDQGRISKRSASPRILTHFVEGFIIQESNYPFTVRLVSFHYHVGINVCKNCQFKFQNRVKVY